MLRMNWMGLFEPSSYLGIGTANPRAYARAKVSAAGYKGERIRKIFLNSGRSARFAGPHPLKRWPVSFYRSIGSGRIKGQDRAAFKRFAEQPRSQHPGRGIWIHRGICPRS